jgi:DNA polymerase III sliding clamp (beta) subunit (PCNA family)
MKITTMSGQLIRSIRAVSLAASKDETRAHLNSVWIRALTGRQPYVFATNGHWLAGCRVDGSDVVEPGLVGTLLPDVKNLLAAAPADITSVTVTNDGKNTVFEFVESTVTVRSIQATPPPVHTIVPDRLSTRKHGRATINVEVLGPALQAVRLLTRGRSRCAGIRLYAMGESSNDPQLLWSAQCPEFFALLMPMRDTSKRDMKWWHDASKSIEAGIAATEAARKSAKATDAAAE